MEKRNIVKRNLLGAFLGGMLGILLCGFLHPYTLPLGCFFGVVVGYWHKEIFQSGIAGWRWSVMIVPEMVRFLRRPTKPAYEVAEEPKQPWFRFRLIDRVYTVYGLAIVVHVILNVLWIVVLGFSLSTYVESLVNSASLDFPIFIVFCALFFLVVVAPLWCYKEVYPPISVYEKYAKAKEALHYRNCYNKYGGVMFFLRALYSFSGLGLFFSISLAVSAIVWILFTIVVIAPILAVVGMIRGVFLASTKTGHWLCFGVTLAVTTLVAWMAYPRFESAQVVWMTALLAGLLSAGAVETCRFGLAWFFRANDWASNMASSSLEKSVRKKIRQWRTQVCTMSFNFFDRFTLEPI